MRCPNTDETINAETTTYQVTMHSAVRTLTTLEYAIAAPVATMDIALLAIAERLTVHPLMLTTTERDERTTEVRIGSGTGLVATVVSL